MPLDPIIARGTQPLDVSNSLIAINRDRIAQRELANREQWNSLVQQRQQRQWSQEDAAAAQEAEEDAAFEAARAKGDWDTMAAIDPDTTKALWQFEQTRKGPPPLETVNLPGYGVAVTQGGEFKASRANPAPQQYGPESFSSTVDAEGNLLLIGNRGTIKETGRKGPVKGGSGVTVGPDGQLTVNPDKASEGERVSAGYLDRMLNASTVIESPEFANYRPTTEAFSGFAALLDDDTGIVGTNIANRFLNDTDRQYMGQALDFILAKMRKESGATIKGGEFRKEYINYFPMPNDSQKVLEQKARKRELALNQLRISGGRAVAPASRDAANAPAGVNPKPVPPNMVTPFASEAEAEKAAKAGIIKRGDRISINGVTGTWQ